MSDEFGPKDCGEGLFMGNQICSHLEIESIESFNRSALSRKKQPLPLTYPSAPHLPPQITDREAKNFQLEKTHLHRSNAARCKSEGGRREREVLSTKQV